MRSSILSFLLTLLLSGTLPASLSGNTPIPNRIAETNALVQRLVLDRAAAVAAVQRASDEKEQELFAELALKDRRLRSEQQKHQKARAELERVTEERHVSDHPKFPPCDHLKIPPSSEPREVWDGQQRENRDASRGA